MSHGRPSECATWTGLVRELGAASVILMLLATMAFLIAAVCVAVGDLVR